MYRKACDEYAVLDADEAAGTLTLDQQIVRREHKQYEHCVECEKLHQQYLALGVLHNALDVCLI
jgi:hypothetical protein